MNDETPDRQPSDDDAPLTVVRYDRLENLPGCYEALFAVAGGRSFYASRPWFECLVSTVLKEDQHLVLLGVERQTTKVHTAEALLVAYADSGAPSVLHGFTSPYTTWFDIVWNAADREKSAVLRVLARYLKAARPAWREIRLDCLDVTERNYRALATALGDGGFYVEEYFHFGNWYEDVSGLGPDQFMARRSSRLRNTIKRKGRKLGRDFELDFTAVDEDNIEKLIAAYEEVHAASWKEAEPDPAFAAELIRASFAAGSLRLGILSADHKAIAAQLWIVRHGKATIFKLSYDEEFKHYSPGSVLTEMMLKDIFLLDGVTEIDFGRGDDPYKASWLGERRERWGIRALNPATAGGFLQSLRCRLARIIKSLRGKGRPRA